MESEPDSAEKKRRKKLAKQAEKDKEKEIIELALYNKQENKDFVFTKQESSDEEDKLGIAMAEQMAERNKQVELLREETESRIVEA